MLFLLQPFVWPSLPFWNLPNPIFLRPIVFHSINWLIPSKLHSHTHLSDSKCETSPPAASPHFVGLPWRLGPFRILFCLHASTYWQLGGQHTWKYGKNNAPSRVGGLRSGCTMVTSSSCRGFNKPTSLTARFFFVVALSTLPTTALESDSYSCMGKLCTNELFQTAARSHWGHNAFKALYLTARAFELLIPFKSLSLGEHAFESSMIYHRNLCYTWQLLLAAGLFLVLLLLLVLCTLVLWTFCTLPDSRRPRSPSPNLLSKFLTILLQVELLSLEPHFIL